MRTPNDSLISAPLAVSGSWTSEPIWVNQSFGFNLQIKFRNATATCKLQVSSDKGNPQSQNPENYNVSNWNDLGGSTVIMDGAGNGTYNVSDANYAWVRMVITGNVDLDAARFNGKGV
jgi:hypothetical protein